MTRAKREHRDLGRGKWIDQSDAHRQLVEIVGHYSAGTHALPSPFFPPPPMAQVVVGPASDGPLGTRVVDLTFPSEYIPFLAEARATYARVQENDTAHVRLWSGGGAGRPTIVLLHGWAGGNQRITAYAFGVTYWLRHGFDVASFVLPFHGARAPGSSGALFPSRDPRYTNEGFGQAIFDLRALAMFLRARGASAVGAIGMSLGGYTTALWASVAGPEEIGGLDFAVGMIPAVSFSRLMWRLGEHSPTRKQAVSAGITEDLLADAFAVH
nr:hypothetical protein [Deltaproteobacteria bacterium]